MEITLPKHKHSLLAVALCSLTLLLVQCKSGEKSARSENRKAASTATSEEQEIKFQEAFLNANRYKITDEPEKAIAYFQKCLKIKPNDPASLFELAQLYERNNNRTEALNYAQKAAKQDEANKWIHLFYARLLSDAKQYKEALPEYQKLARKHPNSVEILYELSNVYLLTGDLKSAVQALDSLEIRTGINEELSVQKYKIYRQLGDDEKAIKELRNLVASFPDTPKYYGRLAKAYQDLGQKKKAIATYEQLKAIDPDNPLVQLSLYEYYLDGGETTKAYNSLREAFGHAELDIDTKVQIVLSYYDKSANDKPLNALVYDLCDSIVTTHPDEAKGFALYGDIYSRDERLAKAREMYVEAVERDDSRFMIWTQLLYIHAQLDDYNQLVKDSERAMDLFPSQPVVYLYNGIGNLQLEAYNNSILALEQGKSLVVDNRPLLIQFHANLGDAYQQLEKFEQSTLNYDKALQLDPGNTYVLNNYAYFLSLRGEQLLKAREMAEKCVESNPKSASYLDTYAWVLYQLKSYDKALDYIEQAYQNGGNASAEVIEHYGDILHQLNRTEEAIEKWKEANLLEPSSTLQQKIKQQSLID